MFTLDRFEIDDFWNRESVKCGLKEDVNIFIGSNGTGKTGVDPIVWTHFFIFKV